MKPRLVALVPMRHHSERVPGKNHRPFAGEPLYRHIVRALADCPLIGETAIDTDSSIIMEDAAKAAAPPMNVRRDTVVFWFSMASLTNRVGSWWLRNRGVSSGDSRITPPAAEVKSSLLRVIHSLSSTCLRNSYSRR